MKKKKKKYIIILMILLILLMALVGGGVYFGLHNKKPEKQVEEPKVEEKEEIAIDEKLEKVKSLNSKYKDLVGWITIENTKVDYPVMYSGDDYYLDHNYKKKYSVEGEPFIDKHNSLNDINLIIHGHNMGNGNMFHDLHNYKKESYYKKHKIIDFYTTEEHKKFEVVAVFITKVYNVDDNVFKFYKFYGDKTEAEYNDYIKNVRDLSFYNIDIDVKYPAKLISLSTCDYTYDNGRLVVVAREMES